jgi:hypothetical protein
MKMSIIQKIKIIPTTIIIMLNILNGLIFFRNKKIFLLFFVFVFFVSKFQMIYGVALHLNSFSGSSSSSASESVVQSFEEESVVQSFEEESVVHSDDDFSNKHLDTLDGSTGSTGSGGSASLSKGETGKYGVETMLTVSSPFMSRMGESVA